MLSLKVSGTPAECDVFIGKSLQFDVQQSKMWHHLNLTEEAEEARFSTFTQTAMQSFQQFSTAHSQLCL